MRLRWSALAFLQGRGDTPPIFEFSVQLVRLVPGRTLGFDAATGPSIERDTELRTQLITSPTCRHSPPLAGRRTTSLDWEHNTTTTPRAINALHDAGRQTHHLPAMHAIRCTHSGRRTASQYAHEQSCERFALIAGTYRQVHSLGTCGGPNRRDRTPTQPDATWTPLNTTRTQRYWTRCRDNQLGGRLVS